MGRGGRSPLPMLATKYLLWPRFFPGFIRSLQFAEQFGASGEKLAARAWLGFADDVGGDQGQGKRGVAVDDDGITQLVGLDFAPGYGFRGRGT